jgi:hypothetical protein
MVDERKGVFIMNHMRILKRAWNILWSYKALWVFGILLALTAGGTFSGNNGDNGGGRVSFTTDWPRELTPAEIEKLPSGIQEAVRELQDLTVKTLPPETINTIIGVAIALICLALLVGVAFIVLRYVSQTALIRMVDRYEASGEKVNWRAGFRLGWSRPAGRLFLIDLLIFLPVFFGILLAALFVAAPVLISFAFGGFGTVVGIVMTIGLAFLLIFGIILLAIALAMAREVFYRECVLHGSGVLDSFRRGFVTIRENLKDLFLMWLLLLAIYIAYAVLMIPVGIVLVILGAVVGAVMGVVLYLVLQAGSQLTALIVGGLVTLFILVLIVGIPMLFLRGLRETYMSAAWTLAYREIPASVPGLEPVAKAA